MIEFPYKIKGRHENDFNFTAHGQAGAGGTLTARVVAGACSKRPPAAVRPYSQPHKPYRAMPCPYNLTADITADSYYRYRIIVCDRLIMIAHTIIMP